MTRSDLSELARAEPGRVLACSVVPVLVAVAQMTNALYHDVAVRYVGLFALSLLGFAVIATQYNLAAYRVTKAWSAADPTAD
jgi:hypothetical protein